MKNRIVGMVILGLGILIGFIVYSFNKALRNIVSSACSHGPECPMWGTIDFQTNVSTGIMIFVIIIGLYLVFFGREEKVITKIRTVKPKISMQKVSKANYQKIMGKLNEDEKLIFRKVIESEGTIFQSDLADKTNFPKVKVTRILDKLEGKGLVERKRRGMTNVVVLKRWF